MILARAVLDCDSIDAAVNLIAGAPRAGAFHLSLAQAGDHRLVSVEFTHAGCSAVEVAQPGCHANHLIHPASRGEAQIGTDSSLASPERGAGIIDTAGRPHAPPTHPWDRTRAD